MVFRYYTSPTGAKLRSLPDVSRYVFGLASSGDFSVLSGTNYIIDAVGVCNIRTI